MLRFPAVYRLLVPAVVALAAPARAEPTDHGAILPSGSREVGKDRYASSLNYEDTKKFYLKVYSPEHYPRVPIADIPGVKATHIGNSGHGGWDGINVYELNGGTRIFVLPKESPKSRKSS